MATVLAMVLLAVAGVLFCISVHRASELFVLRVRPGTTGTSVRFVRGRIPPQLLHELREILSTSNARGTLRVLAQRGAAVVETRGNFSPSVEQRIRNTVGLYALAKLRNGVRPRRH